MTRSPLTQRWKVALANAGLSETTWAEREGVSVTHVTQVVKGPRKSDRLMQKVLAFIEEQERQIAERLNRTSDAA